MFKIGRLVIQPLCLTLSCLWLINCGGSDSDSPQPPSGATPSPTITASPAPTNTPEPTVSASPSPTPTPSPIFSAGEARANLQWAKSQAIKMLGQLESGDDLTLPRQCLSDGVICFPRAVDDGKIQMSQPSQWTNGFWPGILWKLLNARAEISDFSEAEVEMLLTHAMSYSQALFSEAERTTTHDLGFILYDSLGEALSYPELSDEDREAFAERLSRGRQSLASRYSDEVGLIKSWDWTPRFRTSYLDNGSEERDTFDLAAPWQYPVIIDNMMNLEFLLSGTVEQHKTMALSHAQKTFENHYHYAADDGEQVRPIAYHVFDYDSMRPGNWQGLGNVSAWARGQGWSLYGFVSVAEFLKGSTAAEDNPDYLAFADRLVNAIELLMDDEYVPAWDFFAGAEDAAAIAANTDASTTRYSRILDLCDYQIADTVLPYLAYGPVQFPTDILADASVAELASYRSVADEDLIVGDTVLPCGTAPYDLTGRQIPKDSSAAALIASGLYRLAQLSDDTNKRARYIDLGDKIMRALSADYIARAGAAFELGFVLDQATGNLPGGSEIATGIIYADFYFIEANIRRLQL